MDNDIYAIFESYTSGNTVGAANIDHTERGNVNMSFRPTSQGTTAGDLSQDNEEIKAPKEIAKVLKSLIRCANKADYQQMLVDCMHLNTAIKKLIK